MDVARSFHPPSSSCEAHILIIGAGITGLVLAQALKKASIPFTVFERDPHVSFRGKGWGLTIHWSLQTFISLLPQHLVDRLPEVYVDRQASERGENGNFLFFDLRSGEARWKVPPNKRIRLSRERLRSLLLEGLDVQWSKRLASFTTSLPTSTKSDTPTITVHFTDSTTYTGTLLIGADGVHSCVRSTLLSYHHTPDSQKITTYHLPIRLLGVSVPYPASLALKLRALDPFFFQGGDPATNAFMYFSFLSSPGNYPVSEDSAARDTYECQIIISWPYRSGFRGEKEPLDVPEDHEERVKVMKKLADGWAEPFRECVLSIPEKGTAVTAITLEDFVPSEGIWDNLGGRVTLVGDAAHAMTMFRGEGANHGITDVAILLESLLPNLSRPSSSSSASLEHAIHTYEREMIRRTAPAVLTSRRACMDAHDYNRIDDQSPLISRRLMVTEEER
ncbi:hypothetical protein EPUS_05281 [Endocarpon pusillum Z07020]|uniref:FAD-binding domain-containing protein n=1 Tax=Endocarpon pusillum (strain Z07020 / HMAS-L-300199) TaxID=1263415 RepID=U1HDV2_ENDPU|nr:uncharacterized protein EPUS_05281 [Endocarpon pusillum Z07020]ERF68200.1 hypothetical protein EPUS_05281 [Endocarpon pusillum Z07020]